MTITNRRSTIYIILFLAFVLFLWAGLSLLPDPETAYMPDESAGLASGGYDLTGCNFENTVYRTSHDEWESWPGQLLTPQELTEPAPSPDNGADTGSVQYATYRLTLRLNPGVLYGVTMWSSDYAMRLFADGEEVACVGVPAATREENVPRVRTVTHAFTAESGVIEFVAQASNWVHKEGGEPPVLTVGTFENIVRLNESVVLENAVLFGGLAVMGLIHLAYFVMNRRQRASLLFAALCLLLAALGNYYIWLQLFPEYNWQVLFRLEYIGMVLALAALISMIHRLFPGALHRSARFCYLAVCGLYIAVVIITDTVFFSQALIVFQAASGVMAAYTLVRMAMTRPWNAKKVLAFAGAGAVILFSLQNALYKGGVNFMGIDVGRAFNATSGMMVFVFCYALVVALEYADTERFLTDERRMVESLSLNNAALDRLNRMRSDIIATISHESRTPLAVLASYAGLVSMELKAKGMDEQISADLDTIAFEAKHVANLIDNMRKLSQQEEVKTERIALDAGELIRQTTRLYAPIIERGNVKLEVRIDGGAFPVLGNAEELTQVVFNLLQNAKNHTEHGRITASVKSESGKIAVTLSDTGTGIAPELLPHVFERGVTDGKGGTGIGLSICKEVIESHGGRITIASEPEQGTKVTVTLPKYTDSDKDGETDAG